MMLIKEFIHRLTKLKRQVNLERSICHVLFEDKPLNYLFLRNTSINKKVSMYIFSRNNINMKDNFAITITCTCRHQYAERHAVNLNTLSLDTCKQRKKPEAIVFICCQYLLYLNSFVKIKFGDANLKAVQSDFTPVSNFKIIVK